MKPGSGSSGRPPASSAVARPGGRRRTARPVVEHPLALELIEEGLERGRMGARALARRGEEDALEIARAVRRGEELPLARADLDEPAGGAIVEDDARLAPDDVATREDVRGEHGASGQGSHVLRA